MGKHQRKRLRECYVSGKRMQESYSLNLSSLIITMNPYMFIIYNKEGEFQRGREREREMCFKEFCCCWSPTIEGEGPSYHHEASPKFKPTYSSNLPEKTQGSNNSGAKVASTSPFNEKAPKETPVVSKSNEKVTLEEVRPSSLVEGTVNYDIEEPATKLKAQPATVQPKEAVPKVPAKFTDAVDQQPQAKIEHEDIVSTGEFTAKGRTKTTDSYMAEMKAEVDKQSLW